MILLASRKQNFIRRPMERNCSQMGMHRKQTDVQFCGTIRSESEEFRSASPPPAHVLMPCPQRKEKL